MVNNFPVASKTGQLMWLSFPLKKPRDIKTTLVQVPPPIDYNRLSAGETRHRNLFIQVPNSDVPPGLRT